MLHSQKVAQNLVRLTQIFLLVFFLFFFFARHLMPITFFRICFYFRDFFLGLSKQRKLLSEEWNELISRSSCPEVFYRKGVFRNFAIFTGKHLCKGLFFNTVAGLKKETLGQVFSCEFCKISGNTFFYRTLLEATSGYQLTSQFSLQL